MRVCLCACVQEMRNCQIFALSFSHLLVCIFWHCQIIVLLFQQSHSFKSLIIQKVSNFIPIIFRDHYHCATCKIESNQTIRKLRKVEFIYFRFSKIFQNNQSTHLYVLILTFQSVSFYFPFTHLALGVVHFFRNLTVLQEMAPRVINTMETPISLMHLLPFFAGFIRQYFIHLLHNICFICYCGLNI